MREPTPVKRQNIATLVALLIGLGIIAPVYATFDFVTGRSVLNEEPELLVVHVAMAAMPFLILAGKNLYDWLAWIAGVALTISAWALYLYAGLRYHWSKDASGVGGEAAIVLIWPFIVSFICVRIARSRAH
jgi:hypothetical protein